MQPKLSLLNDELIARILEEAYQLMLHPGIKVQNAEARKLLEEAGAIVDEETMIVQIPEQIVRKALETVPRQFHLYDYEGIPKFNMEVTRSSSTPVHRESLSLSPRRSNTRLLKQKTWSA